MARDRTGRFVAKQAEKQAEAPPLPVPEDLRWERVLSLLERIAYNTAQTHLTYEEYLRQRVYTGGRHADHPAAD